MNNFLSSTSIESFYQSFKEIVDNKNDLIVNDKVEPFLMESSRILSQRIATNRVLNKL